MKKTEIQQSKFDGTNIHAMRHGYGQSLVAMNLSPLYIQEMLHHISIESQKVYTRPSDDQINEKLKEAAAIMVSQVEGKLRIRAPDCEVPDLVGLKYNSDPAGIFSPQCLGAGNDRI